MVKIVGLIFLLFLLFGCSDEPEITANVIYDLNETNRYVVEVVEEVEEQQEEMIEEEPEIVTLRICADSDNGNVRWTKGSINGFYSNATSFEFTDYCQNNNNVMEFYCDSEDPKQDLHFCRGGCENGACK